MNPRNPKVTFSLGVAAGIVAMFLLQEHKMDRLRQENRELHQQTKFLAGSNSDYPRANSAHIVDPLPIRTALPGKRPSWRDVESEDYREYILNMRSLEIPEETIRDIVLADIDKLYASRKAEVLKGTVRDEFWKPGGQGRFVGKDRIDALRELSTEKDTVIKDLLGLEIPQTDFARPSNDLESEMEWKWPFISEDKRAAVTKVTRAARRNGPQPDWSSDDINNWRDQYEGSLRQVLSAEEFEEYQMRHSGVSSRLRDQLADFQPNEREFRRLFGLVREFGGPMATSYSQKQWEQVQLNDKKMFESESFQAKANRILGPARAGNSLKRLRWIEHVKRTCSAS